MRRDYKFLLVVILLMSVIFNIYTSIRYNELEREIGSINMRLLIETDNYIHEIDNFLNKHELSNEDMKLLIEVIESFESLLLEQNMVEVKQVHLVTSKMKLMLITESPYSDELKDELRSVIKEVTDSYIINGDYRYYLRK